MIILKILLILLKIIGWLLLILLSLLLTAMCIPVHFYIQYEPEVTLRLRYLFLRFYIMGERPPEKPPGFFCRALAAVGRFLLATLHLTASAVSGVLRMIKKGFVRLKSVFRKPKKKPAAVRKKPGKKKQSFFGGLKEERGFFGALAFFADAGKKLGGAVARMYRGVKIDRLTLHAAISGEDAAETAIQYGRLCAGAFPALSFLLSNTRGYDPANPQTNDIQITPDYAGDGITLYFIGEFTFFPILMIGNLLRGVMQFAVGQIKISSKLKKKK